MSSRRSTQTWGKCPVCKKINDDWKLPGTKKQKEYIIENLEHIPLLCLEKLWLFDESKIASVEYETDYGTEEVAAGR